MVPVLSPSLAKAEVTGFTSTSSIMLNGLIPDPANPGLYTSYSHVAATPPSSAALHFGNTPYGDSQYYQLSVDQTANDIIFANSVSAQGSGSYASASSAINVTFRNTTGHAVRPFLESSITPGSFGMYVVDPTSNPTFNAATASVGDITKNPQSATGTFADWNGGGTPLADVSFNFGILRDNALLKSFVGDLKLFFIAAPVDPVTGANIGQPGFRLELTRNADAQGLNSFGLLTPDGSASAVAYGWSATDLAVDLGTLSAGASATLTYLTTVTVETHFQDTQFDPITGTFDSGMSSQLLAFSGFGDPIGKQGSITPSTSTASTVSGLLAMIMGASTPLPSDLINGVDFARFKFSLPVFDETACTDAGPCVVSLTLQKTPDGLPIAYDALTPQILPDFGAPPPPSAAPEPSVWALMLTSVGMMGAALRRRRRPALQH